MLERIVRLENVGLFKSGVPKAFALGKVALIYADNARGKSTLSAILRACATGDANALNARATIDAKSPPKVLMRFALPAGGTNVTFDNGQWDAAVPHIQVFDQGFVEQNVYAGSEVQPDHHQALLDFAIGSAAVAKKKEVDDHGIAQVAATRARTAAEDKLRGYRGQTALDAFLALPKEEDPDARIAELDRRIANAKEAAALTARAGLSHLNAPGADLEGFAKVLQSTFEQVHENAQATVRAHLEKHGGQATERWVSEGQSFHTGDSCPFCGQATEGLDLIAAYKTYFNAEYATHMRRVTGLSAMATAVLPEASIAAWETEHRANTDRANAWAAQVKVECPPPDFAKLRALAANIRRSLQRASTLKSQTPLEAVDPASMADARTDWAAVNGMLAEYNAAVERANNAIASFKKGLAGENLANLERELSAVRLRKTRHTPDVIAIADERAKADKERSRCETAKAKAREELDALMAAVLGRYQAAINGWLKHFGAPFSVDKLGFTYQGGTTPRTEYGIVLRGKVVPAGRKSANALSFQSVLSDGDKRTLALAFFLARVLDDKDAATNIVVLDDVFASLDMHRRSQTMAAIGTLAQRCAQVIVLGHDAYFLRDLGRRLVEKKLGNPLTLQIRRAAGDFSELDACDLDELCASTYYKRYREVSDYLAGQPTPNLLPVAQALRPLVEGNLHRRFPGLIKEGVTFGVILDQIKGAAAVSPLAVLQPQLGALQAFNDFAGAFHHDTPGVAVRQEVTDGELQVFAKQAIAFVQGGSM